MGQLCLGSFPPCCVLCAPCQFPAPPLMPASPHHLSPTCDVGAEGAASRCLVPLGGWSSGGGHRRNLPLWCGFIRCGPASSVAQGSPDSAARMCTSQVLLLELWLFVTAGL